MVALTRCPGEPHATYLARVAANPAALRVKRAALAEVTDPGQVDLFEVGPAEGRAGPCWADAARQLGGLESRTEGWSAADTGPGAVG